MVHTTLQAPVPHRAPRSRRLRGTAAALSILAVALAGCASAPRTEHVTPPDLHLPGVTEAQAWDGVLDLLAGRGWSVEHSEQASGLITTEWLSADKPDRWMDCGRAGLLRTDLRHQGRFTFTVRPEQEGARVRVAVAWVVAREGTVDQNVRTERCASRGTLEADIYRELHQSAARARQEGGPREGTTRPPAGTLP